MIPRRLEELEKRERRRAVIRTAVLVAVVWIVLITLYYVLPVHRHSEGDVAFRLVVAVVVMATFVGWQTTKITRAEVPELRAAQALGTVIPLFFVVFSSIYLSLSYSSASNFSQSLDRTRALYFTITVFSTVGFGDITPRTDPCRIVVSIQMLLDLVIIGVLVRVLFDAARAGLARRQQEGAGGSG